MPTVDLAAVTAAGPLPDPADESLFPRLTAGQMARVCEFAETREYAAGELLFDQGVRDAPLFVLDAGAADILDRRPAGDVRISRATPGLFIGDTAMFTGHPTVAACVATEPTRARVVPPARLRELVARHSDIGDLLLTTFVARRAWLEGHGYGQASLIGPADCKATYRLREFLSRNQVPFHWHDPSTDADSQALLDRLNVPAADTPVLVCGSSGHVARNPTVEQVADRLGLRPDPGDAEYDLLVVGAGPSGLAAAVYAASEGLTTLVLDADCPGGQAGTSSKIENYLGFLTGISGAELTKQATLQARKFGAVLSSPRAAGKLCAKGEKRAVELADGRRVAAKTVLIASGAEYRRLDCPSCGDFEGRGVYYAASHVEAVNCADQELAVVGGGNSAGQAVVFLASRAKKVYLSIRRDAPTQMSRYLSDRVERLANVEVLPNSTVCGLHGTGHLEAVEFDTRGVKRREPVAGLFVLIGADPRTAWLGDGVLLDDHGFVLTGDELRHDARFAGAWPLDRDPYLLETSVPGVFAAGDVRSGSVKRVAAAVGEGSMCVSFAHRRIAELATPG